MRFGGGKTGWCAGYARAGAGHTGWCRARVSGGGLPRTRHTPLTGLYPFLSTFVHTRPRYLPQSQYDCGGAVLLPSGCPFPRHAVPTARARHRHSRHSRTTHTPSNAGRLRPQTPRRLPTLPRTARAAANRATTPDPRRSLAVRSSATVPRVRRSPFASTSPTCCARALPRLENQPRRGGVRLLRPLLLARPGHCPLPCSRCRPVLKTPAG